MTRFIIFLLSLTLCLPAIAGYYSYKDWNWSNDDAEFNFAATSNSQERVFGQFCYFDSESCYYIIDFGMTCNNQGEGGYPALVNSDIGAYEIDMVCGHEIEDSNAFYIKNFDLIDNIVRKASKISFAVPTASEEFKIIRFSLKGSVRNIDEMRTNMFKRMKNRSRSSPTLKDEERL